MARIRIDLPEQLPFTTTLTLRISDINYGGHLGNDAVLSLVHEARMRFLESLGFSEMDMGGPGLVMTDCAIQYCSQGMRGQQVAIGVGVEAINRKGFELCYRLSDAETDQEIARAHTGMTCFDFHKQKIARLPEAASQALTKMSPCALDENAPA